jgi:phosphonate transport system permease protein
MTATAKSPVPQTDPQRLAELARLYAGEQTAKRNRSLIGAALLVAAILLAAVVAEVDLGKLFGNLGAFGKYLGEIMPTIRAGHIAEDIREWYWGFAKWFRLLLETLLIAYTGTILGFVGGFILCFFAAANMGRSNTVQFVTRRYLELCRTVPELVFALIFVVAFGLGPVPGVLAIAIHTTGALGKLYAEVVENIDMKPVDGLTASGATFVQTVRFAVVPQVLSNFASYALLRFEINVRGAAVMGFVGAGGIGQDLIEAVRKFYFTDVSAILLMIIVAVFLIDLGTERLRHRLISLEASR